MKRSTQALSLHIGLNRVDPQHYQGWDGALLACEYDARDFVKLAKAAKIKPQLMLTEAATAGAFIDSIDNAARQLTTGDLFLLTYSGHGGQVPDKNGDEADGQDETLVFYDREVVDDELYSLWARFAPGVRIVVLADCCHSGTNIRAMAYRDMGVETRFRGMPEAVAANTYKRNRKLYDGIQRATRPAEKMAINASVLLISGCQDNQLSADGKRNGMFSETLLKVWDKGAFSGGYAAFHKAIQRRMPPYQSPNLYRAGVRDYRFEAQKPFSI